MVTHQLGHSLEVTPCCPVAGPVGALARWGAMKVKDQEKKAATARRGLNGMIYFGNVPNHLA